MTELASKPPVVERLTEAADTYRSARAAVEEYGRDSLQELADTYEEAGMLLTQYEDQATDTGIEEFVQFAQFKQSFARLVESLDPELPAVEAFEAAQSAIDKRRLSHRDFERAREELAPVRERISLLDDLADARDQLVAARNRARDRRDELDADRERLRRVERLGTADLSLSLTPLREPVTTYNDAVSAAFETLRAARPARACLDVLTRARLYPLVACPQPPAQLREYLQESAAGTESIATLLEWLDYSPSKLRHYVDDPTAFRRVVATERSFLADLDADPLKIDWPPPSADLVPHVTRSRRRVIGSSLDTEAHQALRRLEGLARDETRYGRLRASAVARDELTEAERKAIKTGDLDRQLTETQAAIDAIDEALSTAPDP